MDLGRYGLLLGLVSVALGVALGLLWHRLGSGARGGRGRSRIGESLHYILGLDYLASHQLDRAIAELTRAVKADTEAIEVYLILGNLFREKGQIERAIQIHQSILHRPKLSVREKAHALLCLGIDFKRGGFRERAATTFEEVRRLDPGNAYALAHLEKIREEEQDWEATLALQEQRAELSGEEDPELAAFLHDQVGLQMLAASDWKRAERSFELAIRLAKKIPPPYLHLSDLFQQQGRLRDALTPLETLLKESPDLAYVAIEQLERLCLALGEEAKLVTLYRQHAQRDPEDWRFHLALGRFFARSTRDGGASAAFDSLFTALERNPHALEIHLAVLKLLLDEALPSDRVRGYVERTESSIFFRDPHLCTKCRYRTSGMLWRCPHCQEWNTFVEDRVSARRPSSP